MAFSAHRRTAALLLIAAMCFVMLFSAFFIAAEAHHDCSGEDCLICAQISGFESVLRTALSCAVLAASCSAVCFVMTLFESRRSGYRCGSTLASLKVLLLN